MNLKKGLTLAFTAVIASAGIAACGGGADNGGAATTASSDSAAATTASATTSAASSSSASADKVIKWGYTWGYPSLDPHKEYNGWNTAAMGLSESLMTIDENLVLTPCLANEVSSEDGKTWNVKLNEKAAFSNGNKLTADIAIANLQRLGAENDRFSRFKDCTYTKSDDLTFTIVSPDSYPTLVNDIASPEAAMVDLDNSSDMDGSPICTGPFVVDKFTPNGDESVKKNENYWNGDVVLDGAQLLVMEDDDSKLMALQNGEIDFYDNVSPSSKAVIETDPSFTIYNVPTTRVQMYLLNKNNLSDKVREAVNCIIDKKAISDFLEGVTTPADTPYVPGAAYGKAKGHTVDVAKAESLLTEDGYTKNASGIFEKDGKPLTLKIKYYSAREFDKVAPLMQEQLKKAGVEAELSVEEDPEGGYMVNGDYDIALYCMLTDNSGDPAYFINTMLSKDSSYGVFGFDNADCQKLIDELNVETDTNKRAELANKIIQMTIDDNNIGYLAFINKVIAAKQGVKNVAENYPNDMFGLFADSTK